MPASSVVTTKKPVNAETRLADARDPANATEGSVLARTARARLAERTRRNVTATINLASVMDLAPVTEKIALASTAPASTAAPTQKGAIAHRNLAAATVCTVTAQLAAASPVGSPKLPVAATMESVLNVDLNFVNATVPTVAVIFAA